MSYEIVKSITIKDNQVYLRSCSNTISPKVYETWVSKSLTEIYQTEGKDGLYEMIGHTLWDRDIQIQKGNKLCSLFLKAMSCLPKNLTVRNTSPYIMGIYFKNAVKMLEKNAEANLTKEINHVLSLRNEKSYIREGAQMYGYNYLNYACMDFQQDREFAMEVVKASRGSPLFEFPAFFKNDKDFAMEALLYNGCWYRQLDRKLQEDHEIILRAFDNSITRRYVEHLPDEIPLEAFYYGETEATQPMNKSFLYSLMEISPRMHLNRASYLLKDENDCIAWYKFSEFKQEAMNLIVTTVDIDVLVSLPFQKELFDTCKDSLDQEILIDLLEQHQIPLQEQAFERNKILELK